mmetsp:Transcript_88529/g.250968  ORF Transcript_88529/g.250968 Transcript_88529/m.250968 type:complete len:206 (+) Transcript_88529:1003-1620(+)
MRAIASTRRPCGAGSAISSKRCRRTALDTRRTSCSSRRSGPRRQKSWTSTSSTTAQRPSSSPSWTACAARPPSRSCGARLAGPTWTRTLSRLWRRPARRWRRASASGRAPSSTSTATTAQTGSPRSSSPCACTTSRGPNPLRMNAPCQPSMSPPAFGTTRCPRTRTSRTGSPCARRRRSTYTRWTTRTRPTLSCRCGRAAARPAA